MKQQLTAGYKTEFEQARLNYLKAVALQETITNLDNKVKTFILENNNFKVAGEWKEDRGIIKNPISDFLMSEEDFKIYLKLCHTERLKRGLNIPSEDLTSDYKSFELLKEAEKQFCEVALKILPEKLRTELNPIKDNYEHRKRFIEISLKLNIDELK